MSDFYQVGVVATLHRLGAPDTARLESDLTQFKKQNPIGLVLPALIREFEHPAMDGIIAELEKAEYLQRVVVAIGQASREQYEAARARFRNFRVPVTALWMEHPKLDSLLKDLNAKDLSAGGPGKGRAAWLSFGYLLAKRDTEIFALHDCDIRNYSRDLLARLVYPLAHPNLGFDFCKGFYARTTDRLHGRVTRLFFTPVVRAIQQMMSEEVPYLRFLDSFRYALAGEFAMRADLARVNRIPSDWGLEVGVLAEVYRNVAVSRVCQVDIADNYEHKHNPLSPEDATKGLQRMSADIAKSLFRTIAQEGFVLTADHFRTLQIYYVRFAQDTIRRYHADAVLNGLKYDHHAEDSSVQVFAKALRDASVSYVEDPLGLPQIPNWNRVASAMPDVFDRLIEAAEND